MRPTREKQQTTACNRCSCGKVACEQPKSKHFYPDNGGLLVGHSQGCFQSFAPCGQSVLVIDITPDVQESEDCVDEDFICRPQGWVLQSALDERLVCKLRIAE